MTGKYINPYTDFSFKKLFGTEMNKDLLISFLNSLFSGNVKEITTRQRMNLRRCSTSGCSFFAICIV